MFLARRIALVTALTLAIAALTACARPTPAATPTAQPAAITPTLVPLTVVLPTPAVVPGIPTAIPLPPTPVPGATLTPTLTPAAAAPVTPAVTPAALATPISDEPAAGICEDPSNADVVTLTLHPDVPSPACQKVRAEQKIKVVNATGEAVTISLGRFAFELPPDQERVLDAPVDTYLAPGMHVLAVSTYSGNGPAVWLEP